MSICSLIRTLVLCNWHRFLLNRPDIDKAKFWRPAANTAFRILDAGEPFIFKLKAKHGHTIVGFGTSVLNVNLPVGEAWAIFDHANGVASDVGMRSRVEHYVRSLRGVPPPLTHEIGCLLVAAALFFPRDLWLDPPDDWSPNIVSGKS